MTVAIKRVTVSERDPLDVVESRAYKAATVYLDEFGPFGLENPVFWMNWPEGHPVRVNALAVGLAAQFALRSHCSEEDILAAFRNGLSRAASVPDAE